MESLSRAVGKLPIRWRRALWLTEVEGIEPDEMAALLGVPEAGGAALARRAREGLRLAHLLVHLRPGTPAECRRTVDRLPAYARTALPPTVAEQVKDHLEACAFCRARFGEYAELTHDLSGPLRPVLKGDDIGRSARRSTPVPAAEEPAAEEPAPRRARPAVAAICVAVATVATVAAASAAVVGLRPSRMPSQGASPPTAALGVPSTTTRSGDASPSPRPMAARPRPESAASESARADDPGSERRARVPASTAPVPVPEPTVAPSSSPRKVCVGVLMVRLCRGVG
ncbi:MAG TPA: zf-HC2 domain-containing protein [Streptosporangiaceae bacterium]|nr:zf-HC2 domain-containing protein [Streptosporangiaceae bacterium]